MTAEATQIDPAGETVRASATIHPTWLRITHWVNAIAVVMMIGSGWEIYNASPLFPFDFPKSITLGGWLAGALLWHFAAMWLFVVNGLVYVTLGILTGRFRRKLLPIRPGDVVADARAALRGRLTFLGWISMRRAGGVYYGSPRSNARSMCGSRSGCR